MLVNLKEILTPAYAGHSAVGSFNCYSYETFRGCIAAGEETGKPVITAFGAAYRAIKAGVGSVMYDGSMLPFAENVANTHAVCHVAHACGVSVEAELGSLAVGADSHEGRTEDVEQYTDPAAAWEFVAATEVDALAVSIGTVHGLYKGKPHIRTDILADIHRAVDVPLVLHGGSGTPEDDLRACIARGIAKINVNTEISSAVVAQTAELLMHEKPHYSVLSLRQVDYVKAAVKKYIGMFG